MHIDMEFTPDEAVTMLRNVGLTVEKTETPLEYARSHGDPEIQTHKVWMVTNPHNGEKQPMIPIFFKYITAKKAELFLTPGRLEILNLFDR